MKFIMVLFLVVSSVAQAQTNDQCKALDEMIGKINNKKRYNFSSVNKIYNQSRISKCDDGAYAKSMSDIVVKSLMLDYVRTLKVAGKNKSATDFVLAHITSTTDGADLVKVAEIAIKMCPSDKKDLCQKIEAEAKNGSKESN